MVKEVLMSVDSHADRHQFNWLLGNFVHQTDGVRDAVAVSSDGLLIAGSDGLDRAEADHLAAIVSSLASVRPQRVPPVRLRRPEAHHDRDAPRLPAGVGRSPAAAAWVVAGGDSDVGLVGYEISLLAERFGDLLTPALISESRQHLPR